MDRRLPISTVTCVRCGSAVPEREADFSADGMLCRTCALGVEVAGRLGVADVGADAVGQAERAFKKSTAIKHLTIGGIGLVGGLVLLVMMGWVVSQGVVSRAILLPFVILAGSITELVRGFTAWSAFRAMR